MTTAAPGLSRRDRAKGEMEWKRDVVQRRVEAYFRHWGLLDQVERVRVRIADTDRPIVVLERRENENGLSRIASVEDDGRLQAPFRESVADVCHQEIRRILRMRALAQAGHTELDAPAWSCTVEALTLAYLRSRGVEPSGHPRGLWSIRSRLDIARIGYEEPETDMGFLRFSRVGPMPIRGGPWMLEHQRGLDLHMPMTIPDTMLVVIPGMMLDQVVDLPFEAPPTRVIKASQKDGVVTLRLKSRLTTCAPVPVGIDRTWLKVPIALLDEIPF